MSKSMVLLFFAVFMTASLGSLALVLVFGKPAPARTAQSETGCACASTTKSSNKFLIFWKEKDVEGFKVSEKLFDSIVDAWKTVPPTAAEVRIVTVRID